MCDIVGFCERKCTMYNEYTILRLDVRKLIINSRIIDNRTTHNYSKNNIHSRRYDHTSFIFSLSLLVSYYDYCVIFISEIPKVPTDCLMLVIIYVCNIQCIILLTLNCI